MTRSPQFIRLCQLLREKSRASTDFKSVVLLMTQELCQWFHCEWGTFWQVDSSGSALDPVASWREPSLNSQRNHTHRFSLDEVIQGYQIFGERSEGVLKVAIKP